jgi:EAL domain-containing protein (putative c-di-GMP-specific phosphodiesterase class I)
MGVKLVLDDFGTGYSSLSHLRRLPVSQIKIDKSFIAGLGLGEDEALVRSIIDLAHNLKLEVVAEGVESAAVCDRLRALGCDLAQGHYLSEPGPAAEIAARVTRRDQSRFEAV